MSRTIWCNEGKRNLTDDFGQCEDCEYLSEYPDDEQCEYAREHEEKFKHMRVLEDAENELKQSEVIAKARLALTETFGIKGDVIEEALGAFVNTLQEEVVSELKKGIRISVMDIIEKMITEKFNVQLTKLFKEAIHKEVVQFVEGGNIISSIQQHCAKAINKFFDANNYASKDKRRNLAEKTTDDIIKKMVAAKTEAVMDELKTEAINKFNAEMMKSMMKGMANEIQANPRLLAMIVDSKV